MFLRIRALRLRAETADTTFGAEFRFGEGLNIIRADNTAGKSTCIQAIIYALGLEGMLSATHIVPLPHAMTDRIDYGGLSYPVLESWVDLEVQNQSGEVLSLRRMAKSSSDKRLIQVQSGAVITGDSPRVGPPLDYFVRVAGAATNQRGFHRMFEDFIGATLPDVPTFSGGATKLYLECMFGLLAIEQKRGWSAINAQIPSRYGIKDPAKRAVEYLLGLGSHERALARASLLATRSEVAGEWVRTVGGIRFSVNSIGGRLQMVPDLPRATWPPEELPVVAVLLNEQWAPIDAAVESLAGRLDQLDSSVIPSSVRDADALKDRLAELREQSRTTKLRGREIAREIDGVASRKASTVMRVASLEADLAELKDLQRLLRMGAVNIAAGAGAGTCPTCGQAIADWVFGQAEVPQLMSVEESVQFSLEQLDAVKLVARNLDQRERDLKLSAKATDEELGQLARVLDATEAALGGDYQAAQLAVYRERATLVGNLEQLRATRDQFLLSMDRLGGIAARWRAVEAQLADTPAGEYSPEDERRIEALERKFREQLVAYGFSSISPSELNINRTTLKPDHGGFDLHFDVSASDLVRAIWAYVVAMMECGSAFATNHPGLLILDEPRQQETNRQSFAALIARLSQTLRSHQQVILATSEPVESISALAQIHRLRLHAVEGRVLQPLGSRRRQ